MATESPAGSRPSSPGLDRWVLAFTAGAFIACYLATTTLGVMQPSISADLELRTEENLWVLNAYILSLTLFTAPAGRLGDSYGQRRLLLVGLAVLGVGSLVAAAAPSFAVVVAGLAVQGVGGAALMPCSVALVTTCAPPGGIGRAIGTMAGVGTLVFALGPLGAGFLTELISWRVVFVLGAVGVAGLVLVGIGRVPETPTAARRIDVTGVVTLLAGLGALLVAVIQALRWGWDAPPTVVLFGAGVVILAAFVVVELREREPLLDLRLLADRAFGGPTSVLVIAQLVVNAYVIYVATYLQEVLGLSALVAGVGMLVAYVFPPWQAPVVGRLTDRLGPRPLALTGVALLTAGMAAAAAAAGADSYWLLIPSLAAIGLGQPYALTSLIAASSTALPPAQRGEGEGLVTALRWVGAAVGTSVIGLVVNTVRLDRVDTASAVDAAIDGYRAGFALGAVIGLSGLVMTFVVVEGKKAAPEPAT